MHYYTQKGFSKDYLCTLDKVEKAFYEASMEIALEERAEEIEAVLKLLITRC